MKELSAGSRRGCSDDDLGRRRLPRRVLIMAMRVAYTVVNGRVLSENRGGTKRDYVSDSLGNTVALLDSTQTKTDTWTYWPYGEVRTRTGTNATPFQFVGGLGYYRDSALRTYVR